MNSHSAVSSLEQMWELTREVESDLEVRGKESGLQVEIVFDAHAGAQYLDNLRALAGWITSSDFDAPALAEIHRQRSTAMRTFATSSSINADDVSGRPLCSAGHCAYTCSDTCGSAGVV